jgi:hypothetical protein
MLRAGENARAVLGDDDFEGELVKVYRFLAYAIAALVVVQAFAIAWAFFGMVDWITDDGGVVNKTLLECEDCDMNFTAEWGFLIHMFFNGLILIPLCSLALLITSFFAKVPGGVKYAAIIFGLIVLQVLVLPALSRSAGSAFGGLHGANALVLMGVAIMAGRRATAPVATATPAPTSA